jgi:hypothetical protein
VLDARRALTMGLPLLAVCAVLATAKGQPTTAQDEAVSVTFGHGFRCHPTQFAEKSDSLEAVLVRCNASAKPSPDGDRVLHKRITITGTAHERQEQRMTATDGRPEYGAVLLEDVVADWKRITGDLKEHQAVVGDAVYVQPCVYLTTHLVEMWAGGWKDMDFDTVAAVSGCSALFGYQPGTFMPKYAHVWIGMHDRIAQATGFGYEWVKIDGADRAWDVVKASIDAGQPVKGWYYENLLFGGYQDAAERNDRKVFVMADGPDTIAEWWTWEQFGKWVKDWSQGQVGRHTERVEAAPERETALRVMRDLVECSHTHPERVRQEYPEAKFGLEGIEAYANDCADTETYEDWSACHPINPQWTIRNSTGMYLERVAEAGLFPEDATAHIATAARHYRAAFSDWQEFYDLLGHHAPEGAGKMKDRREAGAAVAHRWLEHEKAAIAKLEQALALLGE